MKINLRRAHLFCASVLALSVAVTPVLAKDPVNRQAEGVKTKAGTNRYIVMLDDAGLVERLSQGVPSPGQGVTVAPERLPGGKLNMRSDAASSHLQAIDDRFGEFEAEVAARLGRELTPVHRYRVAVNGFSARLTDKEAVRLAKMDGVRSVRMDEHFKLETDAGPGWIGADRIWEGEGFVPSTLGEGIVVGIIDSGSNFTHPSFDDPGEGQQIDTGIHDFENPYGEQLGLCSDPEVLCNDKLVGVYDFVEDDPDTEVVEEFNNGEDNGAHGAHTASTAAGNPIGFTLVNGAPLNLSGVAPEANIISYRVCYAGDPNDPDDDACQGSAILAAIDQAIIDGVDVINYSVGGGAFDPWVAPDTLAFLSAVEAGIFVATSAGNSGPGAGTMGRPANAPWITAVGSATHDRVFASILKATSGGDTTPPGDLIGESFTLDGISETRIVHAKDFGSPLCGTGTPELQPSCESNTGASNPFPPGTFNGEIVVCDRGTYGRIEKSKNLLEAGAGGYVLANTGADGEDTEFDQHCLPGTHLGQKDGDVLRDWLNSGSNHLASLTGFLLFNSDEKADQMSGFSSRGPNPSPAEDVLKPNLIAPGDFILAADNESNGVIFLGGTSMASPHVAGGAALLKANNPDMTPAQIASVLELTATDEVAKNNDGGPVTHFDTGAGRPRLYEAATAGIYLEETGANFRAADPFDGGDPTTLNLASMTNANCTSICSFTREISSFVNGRTWTVSTSGFPDDVVVTVNPESFSIINDTPQTLEVTVDLTNVNKLGEWIYGKVHIDNGSFPTSTMPVSVAASAGSLPVDVVITTDLSSGYEDFNLGGLIALPQVNLQSGGLVEPLTTTVALQEDISFDDPFDGGQGVFTLLYDVPDGALWLHADTPSSPSEDLDLYVGLDANNDGMAQQSEIECISADFDDIENCEIFQPEAGVWWVLVQNFEDGDPGNGTGPAQEIDLVTYLVNAETDGNLVATGPGTTESLDSFDVRVAWDNVNALPGATLYGAVSLGSTSSTPGDIGVVPLLFVPTGIDQPQTTALFDGELTGFALDAGETYEGLFIDIPPGVSQLDLVADGATGLQADALNLQLYQVDFDDAFVNAPNLPMLPAGGPVVEATGSGGQGPSVSVDGSALQPGRWIARVSNQGTEAVSVTARADLQFGDDVVEVSGGLWEPASRPGISQGFEYSNAGLNRALLWYTYNQDGTPAWYLGAQGASVNNIWTTSLLRFTNDGESQAATAIGSVSVSMLDENDSILTWRFDGSSGSERMTPLSRSCPEADGQLESYSGIWFRGVDGLGGASVIVNRTTQGQIHYLYDDRGNPRWLLGAGAFEDPAVPLLQFSGFCPSCSGSVSSTQVGALGVSYDSTMDGSWTLDYLFESPVTGSVTRTDSVIKLTDPLICEP